MINQKKSSSSSLPSGRYFKYAIGEIVLVVIGILIALQINNWNDKRLENKQMIFFLQGIKEDLKFDISEFNRRIILFNTLAENKKNILELSSFDHIDADSLYRVIQPRISNYEINATTFDKIKSLGITQISENDSLSNKIYFYYTSLVISLKSNMDWDLEGSASAANYYYYGNNVFEINLDIYNFDDSDNILSFQDETSKKKNLVKIITEPEGRNHVKLDYARKKRIANALVRYKERAENLITDIEKELAE